MNTSRRAFAVGLVALAAVLLVVGATFAVTRHDTREANTSNRARPTADLLLPKFRTQPPITFTRPPGRPARVMLVGTSLFAGYYTRIPENIYAARVLNRIRRGGPVQQIVADRVPGGNTLISSYPQMPRDLDIAIVELGTNDVTIETPNEFRARYQTMIEQVRERSPAAAIYCLGEWRTTKPGASVYVTSYLIETREACEQVRGTYVPIDDIYDEDGTRGPKGERAFQGIRDDFHPNDEGHKQIADRVVAAIARAA